MTRVPARRAVVRLKGLPQGDQTDRPGRVANHEDVGPLVEPHLAGQPPDGVGLFELPDLSARSDVTAPTTCRDGREELTRAIGSALTDAGPSQLGHGAMLPDSPNEPHPISHDQRDRGTPLLVHRKVAGVLSTSRLLTGPATAKPIGNVAAHTPTDPRTCVA